MREGGGGFGQEGAFGLVQGVVFGLTLCQPPVEPRK